MLSRQILSLSNGPGNGNKWIRLVNQSLSLRHYARGFQRRPIRVLSAEEAEELGRSGGRQRQPLPVSYPRAPPRERPSTATGATGYTEADHEDTRFNTLPRALPSHMRYEKLEEGDKRFGPVIMTAKSRKMREKSKTILLEGNRLIMDAIKAGVKIKSLYFTRVENLEGLPLEKLDTSLYKVFPAHMKIWSELTTMPGLMAICERPRPDQMDPDPENKLPITLVCDNIRDPGNMGTLLRSAVAVGCRRVLATKGCVDVWEPKVLRSAAGAHFSSLIILNNVGWEMVGNYLSPDSDIYLADQYRNTTSQKRPNKFALKKILETSAEKYVELNEDTGESVDIDTGYLDKDTVEMYKMVPLGVSNYCDAEYGQREVVIVLGGETEGLSAAAHKLAFDNGGAKIFVPMAPQIESLNAAIAGSVILFEVKRQVLQALKDKAAASSEDRDTDVSTT